MLKVVFTGSFAARLAGHVRVHLTLPCQLIAADEAGVLAPLADADVLVSMRFSASMAEAGQRLRLLQGPGAGLDRIARSVLRPGTRLANAFGHEGGITEDFIGAMIALSCGFARLDDTLRRLDFLAITLPLSAATRNLIDARRPQVLKPTAFSTNVARAEIVKEANLYQALSRKRLTGAALDVWCQPQASPRGPPGSHFTHWTTC
jgi:phosphoglycerate dehydrogenase-like enzyme